MKQFALFRSIGILVSMSAFMLVFLTLSGCLVAVPELKAEYTPIPQLTPLPTELLGTAEPSLTPTEIPTPTLAPVQQYDALGALVSGNQHYMQYLSFHDIQVYEQADDTFMDAVATNNYPESITCAVVVRFFDEFDEEVANANLRMRTGQYVLILEPGDNYIFAQIDTDMVLTSLNFTLEYDMTIGVLPVS